MRRKIMRDDLIAKLEAAALLAEGIDEMNAAGILWTLIGALSGRIDDKLFAVVAPFIAEALQGCDSELN
jgi:hypothetical protein